MPSGGSRNSLVVGRVIGDVLDPFQSTMPMRISYGNRDVTNGCELKPSHVVNQPRVTIGGDDLRNFYTLLCDYMLVTDIPATTGANFGNVIVNYEKPLPTMGIHRFVFVLFRQPGRQTVYAPGWRQNFNTREFAELYNLSSPVAALFFNCQRESGSGGRTMMN
ncbi:protein FLOWERING LOCUS T-like [Arachis ipaensis]|uniref:protein FLOWERING LOCUS T-like n=1 Tax=Arachis ipaensis TaxID=130454 RepID=UPI0007AF9832|nr:protein FLOWERING LOCUS T-like [Arachis ipaensis]